MQNSRSKLRLIHPMCDAPFGVGVTLHREPGVADNRKAHIEIVQLQIEIPIEQGRAIGKNNVIAGVFSPHQIDDIKGAQQPAGRAQIDLTRPRDEFAGGALVGIKVFENESVVKKVGVEKGVFERVRIFEILQHLFRRLLQSNEVRVSRGFIQSRRERVNATRKEGK